MPSFRALNSRNGQPLAERVIRADRFGPRLKGLLGRGHLPPGEGLHLVPCSAIHTFFMRFAFDAAFLDAEGRVVKLFPALKPWRLGGGGRSARSVLELPSGTLLQTGTDVGDMIRFHQV